MLRRTTRLVVILCASLALLGVLAMPAQAKPGGNAGNSAACENGGYLNYTTTDGTAFKNEGQCAKYAAKGNTLVPVVTEDPAVTRCEQEAAAAGYDPSLFNIIAGTENDETLTPTAGSDLICGFGGADYVQFLDGTSALEADDVFLGGDGNDVVVQVHGTFDGGAGDDSVYGSVQSGGTFNGGDGNDSAGYVTDRDPALGGGTFNGGAGDDFVYEMGGGTFNGGDDNDSVDTLNGGTFNGGDGDDSFSHQFGGTFNQE